MKGIILAGGTGSRLFPLTKVTNKHLLPVGKYPMIFYPIAKMKQANIKDIMIISGKEHMGDIVNLLGSGYEYGVRLTFRVQDKPGGIAEALGLCEDFVGEDKCTVILGDNIFEDNICEYIEQFNYQEKGAKVLLKEVIDPSRYGIAEVKEGQIVSIEEKPDYPKSNMCVTGIYMYDNRVFDVIKGLDHSQRDELEITDVNNWYADEGSLNYNVIEGWWIDAGTVNSLIKANMAAEDTEFSEILTKEL